MSQDLDALRKQIADLLKEGTRCISGIKLIKAVPKTTVMKILKSGGVLTASELLIQNPDDLFIQEMARQNDEHPAFRNVIYATAVRTQQVNSVQQVNKTFGYATIVMKDSVLNRPNTTYTHFDTQHDRTKPDAIELYKGELLTESDIIKAEKGIFGYLEVQIRSTINLGEIEKIVYHNAPPTEEEKALANQTNVPIFYNGEIVAGNIPKQEAITIDHPIRDTPADLPDPKVYSPELVPIQLPDFEELPKPSPVPKIAPPIDPDVDPMPTDRIPNFKEFKSTFDVYKWLEDGKDIEIDFPIKNLFQGLKEAATDGNAGIWHDGIRYTSPFS